MPGQADVLFGRGTSVHQSDPTLFRTRSRRRNKNPWPRETGLHSFHPDRGSAPDTAYSEGTKEAGLDHALVSIQRVRRKPKRGENVDPRPRKQFGATNTSNSVVRPYLIHSGPERTINSLAMTPPSVAARLNQL